MRSKKATATPAAPPLGVALEPIVYYRLKAAYLERVLKLTQLRADMQRLRAELDAILASAGRAHGFDATQPFELIDEGCRLVMHDVGVQPKRDAADGAEAMAGSKLNGLQTAIEDRAEARYARAVETDRRLAALELAVRNGRKGIP